MVAEKDDGFAPGRPSGTHGESQPPNSNGELANLAKLLTGSKPWTFTNGWWYRRIGEIRRVEQVVASTEIRNWSLQLASSYALAYKPVYEKMASE